jgi:hypothetical protein
LKSSRTRSASALSLLLIFGCQARDTNESRPSAPEAARAKPQAPLPPPAPPPAPGGAVQVPTEEDFEEEASQKITSKNLEEELDRLEKELEGK